MVKLTTTRYPPSPVTGKRGGGFRTVYNTDWIKTPYYYGATDVIQHTEWRWGREATYLYEIPEEAVDNKKESFPNESNWMNFQVHAQDEELPIYDEYVKVFGYAGVPF
tara:strand:- start:331 stop:654 length:324 start_codon:yes stop_codon:yes gene_type:complete